jgi:hypothetical protein
MVAANGAGSIAEIAEIARGLFDSCSESTKSSLEAPGFSQEEIS